MKRWLLIICIAILSVSILFVYEYYKYHDGKLHVTFCNVGQGDAVLIRTPKGKNILFDSGPDKSILNCLSKHLPFWERRIDKLILSHPHSDHYFGMYYVIDRYIALMFDMEDVNNKSIEFTNLLDRVNVKNIPQRKIYAGDTYQLNDGVSIKAAGPSKDYLMRNIPTGNIGESKEQASLILQISYGDFDLLLTGDSATESIRQALPFINEKIEVLQIPHHGSKTGLTQDEIRIINPGLAVISVGKNKYGHPSKEILQLFNSEAVKVLRTDENGDIEIVSNGKGYMIQNDID